MKKLNIYVITLVFAIFTVFGNISMDKLYSQGDPYGNPEDNSYDLNDDGTVNYGTGTGDYDAGNTDRDTYDETQE